MAAVSVIIPIYNMERYLKRCLDSVIGQSLRDIEIICIDDGSTDHSVDIVNQYSDNRIHLFCQPNGGAGKARNKGLRQSTGRFVSFIDPDDYYLNRDVLELLYTTAVEKDVLICGGNILNVFSDGRKEKGHRSFEESGYIDFSDFQDCYYHQRYLISRNMLVQNNIFYPDHKRYQDPPFLLRAMLCAGRFYAVNSDIYGYQISEDYLKYSAVKVRDMLLGMAEVLKLSSDNNLRELHERCWRSLFTVYWKYIVYYLLTGDMDVRKAAETVDKAIDIEIIGKKPDETYLTGNRRYSEYKRKYLEQIELKRLVQEEKSLIIYGAGKIGKRVKKYIEEQRKGAVIGIAVTERTDSETASDVRSIDDYIEYRDKAWIIVAVSQAYQSEIREHLIELEFKNIFCIDDIAFDFL